MTKAELEHTLCVSLGTFYQNRAVRGAHRAATATSLPCCSTDRDVTTGRTQTAGRASLSHEKQILQLTSVCHYQLHTEARQQPELSSETMLHDTAIFLPDPGRLHSANTHSLILVLPSQTSWCQLSNYYSCVQICNGMNEKLAFGRKTQLLTKETVASDMSKGRKKIRTISQFSSMVGFGGF